MSKMKILVDGDTRLKDLKVGDLVMTAEIHRVAKIKSKSSIVVTDYRPQCEVCGPVCCHESIMNIGWGQHSIAKVLKIFKGRR